MPLCAYVLEFGPRPETGPEALWPEFATCVFILHFHCCFSNVRSRVFRTVFWYTLTHLRHVVYVVPPFLIPPCSVRCLPESNMDHQPPNNHTHARTHLKRYARFAWTACPTPRRWRTSPGGPPTAQHHRRRRHHQQQHNGTPKPATATVDNSRAEGVPTWAKRTRGMGRGEASMVATVRRRHEKAADRHNRRPGLPRRKASWTAVQLQARGQRRRKGRRRKRSRGGWCSVTPSLEIWRGLGWSTPVPSGGRSSRRFWPSARTTTPKWFVCCVVLYRVVCAMRFLCRGERTCRAFCGVADGGLVDLMSGKRAT